MKSIPLRQWGPGPYFYAGSLVVGNLAALYAAEFADDDPSDDEESHVFKLDGGDVVMLFRGPVYEVGTYALMAMIDDSARILTEFVAESSGLDPLVV